MTRTKADAALNVLIRDKRTRRVFTREPLGTLTCSFGEVLDLSKGGARVLSRKKPFGGQQRVKINSVLAGTIELDCTVAWAAKVGWRRYVLGLQFVGVSPRSAHQLRIVAEAHKVARPQAA